MICVEVLEHLDGHEAAVSRSARVLRPGGVFLFTTPNVMSIKSRLSFLWTGFEHSFYPLEVGDQIAAGMAHLGLRRQSLSVCVGAGRAGTRGSRLRQALASSLTFAWLAPMIMLRSWLRHGSSAGAKLNNSLPALFGRTMIGVAEEARICGLVSHCGLRIANAKLDASAIAQSAIRHSTIRRVRQIPPNRLSVIIPCKNEEEHIRACIVSAQQVADEVLVADSGSTDGTLEIARELGCRIIEREYGTQRRLQELGHPAGGP